jgi:CO/xanthine dehydrogenase FAD-binding subunit
LASARRVRDVAADDFFLSPLTTVLEPDEVLSEVAFPVWPGASGALVEVTRRHGDFAIAGAAVALSWSNGVIVRAGVAPHPIRVPAEILVGSTGSDDVRAETAALARTAAQPTGDYHASAEYRRAMAGETVLMALEQAVAERPKAEDQ